MSDAERTIQRQLLHRLGTFAAAACWREVGPYFAAAERARRVALGVGLAVGFVAGCVAVLGFVVLR